MTGYLEDRANLAFDQTLDRNNYESSDLITIKVPNRLAYSNSTAFERINGQIEIEGVFYNYVAIKVSPDFLELRCIPNHEVTRMKASKAEFFKLVNDLQRNGQGKKGDNHSSGGKNFSIDSYTLNDLFALGHPAAGLNQRSFAGGSSAIPTCWAPTAEQPPDIA